CAVPASRTPDVSVHGPEHRVRDARAADGYRPRQTVTLTKSPNQGAAADRRPALQSGSGWLPALSWLRTYDKAWLRGDFLAAITLAAYLLPAALGDASLANLPPQAGLYACLFGGLVFWIFCGSRYTAASVTSAISLVIGFSLGEITGGNSTRFGALAAGTALLVSLI